MGDTNIFFNSRIFHIVNLLLLVLYSKVFQKNAKALDLNNDSPKAYLAYVVLKKSQTRKMGCLKMIIKLN